MVRKGYSPEQVINQLREGEAIKTASARGHPARANDSNSNLTSGIITGGRSLSCGSANFVESFEQGNIIAVWESDRRRDVSPRFEWRIYGIL